MPSASFATPVRAAKTGTLVCLHAPYLGCSDPLAPIDMSPALFKAVGASLEQGVIDIQWHFMKKGFRPF